MLTREFEIFIESERDLPLNIFSLNEELNSYDYGIIINGKRVTKNIDFRNYKTIPVNLFKRYKCGVCWDFVNYEAYWFRKRGYKFKTYYIVIDNNKECPTHTFLVFQLNGKSYYFESSWFTYQGIRVFNTDKDAIKFVLNNHRNADKEYLQYPYYIYEYDTTGMDNYLSPIEFMTKIATEGKEIKGL